MSIFSATLAPPQSYEAVEAARDILAGDSNIVDTYFIDDAEHVFVHYSTEEDESGAPTPKPDRYLVVREVKNVGSSIQTQAGHLVVRFQVMAVIDKNEPAVHKWLGAMHRRVFASIVGQKPSTSLGTFSLPINRESVPSTAALDDDTDEWYSTADFFATLKPV